MWHKKEKDEEEGGENFKRSVLGKFWSARVVLEFWMNGDLVHVFTLEKETKSKTGKLGSGSSRHLKKKRTSKTSKKHTRGSGFKLSIASVDSQ